MGDERLDDADFERAQLERGQLERAQQPHNDWPDHEHDHDHDHDIYSVGTALDGHRGFTDAGLDATDSAPRPARASLKLSMVEGRVLGSLIEKQFTTPDLYPLSLNGLVLACNQSTNRDPLMSLGEAEALAAMTSLKEKKLARFVHPTSGRGVTKYRQIAEETLGLEYDELVVLGVLLLRGPQTSGELRLRSERSHAFDSVDAVESTLQRLNDHLLTLAHRLTRQPGQKEARWQQLFAEEAEPVWLGGAVGGDHVGRSPGGVSRVDELTARVTELESTIADLQSRLTRLEEIF